MFRTLIGLVTAVAAAGVLVGVAWASDEAGNESRSDSIGSSTGSNVSASVTVGTPGGDAVGSSTDVTIVDGSSTSTSVDATTSTSRDDGPSSSTSSTFDDHSTVPVTTEVRTYDVHEAGSVTVQLVAGELVLVDAEAAAGWTIEVDKSDGRDIRVEFENSHSDARFEAKIRHGEVRVEIRRF